MGGNLEGICRRCGRCCVLKEIVDGGFFRLLPKDCPNLSRMRNGRTECLVYPDRLHSRLGNGNVCVPIKEALKHGELPPDCPYAMGHEGYKTKVIDWMVS